MGVSIIKPYPMLDGKDKDIPLSFYIKKKELLVVCFIHVNWDSVR